MKKGMRILSENLTKLRKSRGLTMTRCAKDLGISLSTLRGYEKMTRFPKPEFLERIAEYFNVSLSDLLGTEDAETPGRVSLETVLRVLSKNAGFVEKLSRLESEDMWDLLEITLDASLKKQSKLKAKKSKKA